MRNIALVISYDGTDYRGFQSQPEGYTVQDKLEEAIRMLTGERVKAIGSGRTDAGVHARCQVVNFETHSAIPIDRWTIALNTRLPNDIVVQRAWEVSEQFHARKHAIRKTYRYTINCNRIPDLFRRRYEFHHPAPLDVKAMHEAICHLIGKHDFSAFTSPHSVKPSHIRTILDARVELETPSDNHINYPSSLVDSERDQKYYPGKQRGILHVYVTGTGFLYNMVRIITGTLIQVGEGKRTADQVASILASMDRARAGPTAVPQGLTLWEVAYPDGAFEAPE
ncbi:tRNA pseudouridine(38-40) synthase TruA [Cohnella soli]|uniref:tRNA pseudouridine synthase A n=1 Tax=Cohnella soli TaxID=425005 RepID=A0ABW0HRY9_9BACL